jgi:hypothetical protein
VTPPSTEFAPERTTWPPDAPPQLPLERLGASLRLDSPRARAVARAADDWPRTTRVLPWLVAAFIAMLWLVPFNSITLGSGGPIDLRFDRLVLPVILLIWVLAIAAGGPSAPRVRATPIHVAIGSFVAVAFVSVVIEAPYLNQILELDTSIKKLTLLLSYAAMFVLVASAVRRSEVRAFMTYTLILACLCAVGILWEYRFAYNFFYSWSDKLLPGMFHVLTFDPGAVDEIGRRQTRGPAELGLEAASMLAMALPIALVGIMQASRWKHRLLYGLAACLLMAAAISTYRKTAFLAPVAVVATLAYYRRRELLRLAPLAVVLVVAVHVLSPGALGAITDQLQGHRLAAAQTVNDRTSDYDAIRPDALSRPALGLGYGAYEQPRNRILDSQILGGLVETGVIGLLAYLAMIVSVMVTASPAIRSRDPAYAPLALAAAAGAAAFLTVSWLYDAMAFPHGPYIFLTLAAFVAIIARSPEEAS